MKLFTYLALSVITLITVILSIETFYYSNDVNPILFIVLTFIVVISLPLWKKRGGAKDEASDGACAREILE